MKTLFYLAVYVLVMLMIIGAVVLSIAAELGFRWNVVL